MIGRLLGGRYEILERIGSGGMSVVYRGRCLILNRTVAIKVLRDQYTGDEEFVTRFKREAMAAASLSHPNVLSVFDVGEDRNVHYIVMEYVEGETLRDWIQRGPIKPAVAADIAIQICDALTSAHRKRVVHRDIKPLNIMITTDGRVKVADFGIALAAAASSITTDGTVLGSAAYLSPEQARGLPVTHRSDIYSLGVVLYEMVTGRPPFSGGSPVAVAMKHVTEDPVRPSRVYPAVAPAMEAVIMKAMARDPDDRFATAADMKSALQEFQGAGGDGPPDGGVPPGEDSDMSDDQAPRRRMRVGRWVAAIVVLMALGWIAAYGANLVTTWFDVPTLTLPDVVGMDLTEAEDRLREEGLNPVVSVRRHDEQVAINRVLTQLPRAGELVRQGRDVELTVSLGPRLVTDGVPDLIRIHHREAEVRLRSAGLSVGRVTREHHESVPADYVIGQNPRPGTSVPEGTAVDLEISLGPEPIRMPNLIGLSLDAARERLAEYDLDEGVVTIEHSSEPEGSIFDQEPLPGELVVPGSPVNLMVSSGPEIKEERTRVWISVPGDGARPRTVTVELQDIRGRQTIYEGSHRPGDRFELDVVWRGDAAHLRVFVDGELAAERSWP